MSSDQSISRSALLQRWFNQRFPEGSQLEMISGDASFRRYFRGEVERVSYILVDAPPQQEDSSRFLEIQEQLISHGVRVPKIIATDLSNGFMCLQDFGDTLLWTKLKQARQLGELALVKSLYAPALEQLSLIQSVPADKLPEYDEAQLSREMDLFRDWLCVGLLQQDWTEDDESLLQTVYEQLISISRGQPQVFVHRDYHSRNLMFTEEQKIGVIDFQDAMKGPLTYDLVSLLKDCYVSWPLDAVEEWSLEYLSARQQEGLYCHYAPSQFIHDFHAQGIQRQLKASGIFCRLLLRDGKAGYLGDIPRTLHYLISASHRVAGLEAFGDWVNQKVMQKLKNELAERGIDWHVQ
jgi:aminoglycoside/choline kinase family phosphotransferase